MSLRFPIALWLLFAAFPACAQQRPPAAAGFEISGRLINSVTGDVVRGASLELAAVTQRQDVQHLAAAADGSFEFHNLAPGKYSLGVQAPGFPNQLFEQHGPFSTAVVVGPDKISKGIIFRVRPEGSISGRVLDEHNEGARNAQVLLFEKSTDSGKWRVERRGQNQTDDLGEYHFYHLHAGTYYLAVTAQPWYNRYVHMGGPTGPSQPKPEIDPALDVAYPVTYYPGATDADNAGAVVLHAGDRISADFDLVPVQSLHLTIRGNADSPPIQPNFRERVFGEPWGFMQPTMSWTGSGNNESAEVHVSGIAPGNYDVVAMRRNGGGDQRNREVSLSADGELDLSATDNLEGIHGKLKFDSDAPENPIIQLRDLGSGQMMMARVDEKGEFALQPEHAGRYVIALGNSPGYAIRTISATGASVSGRTVEFAGTQAVELSISASQGVGTVNGTVMKDDKPVSAAMVVLVPQNAEDNLSLFRRDQSDSDGTFTLPEVVPGTYTAIALQNGWEIEWASGEALRPYLAKGTRVQVSGKQKLDIKIASQ